VGYPRSYTKGRARAPQYVTLHYTAGSEGPSSAENGAAYDKTRTDGTSCHVFTDSYGLPCRELPDGDRAHTALWHGNEIGIHIEICGTRQSRAQWLDDTSYATLRRTAALVADICKRNGFPHKRLSVDETRAAYYGASGKRPKGINDHNTITLAYPEDGGSHTDVGDEFPWDVFMDLLAEADGMSEARENNIIATDARVRDGIGKMKDTTTYTLVDGKDTRTEDLEMVKAIKRVEAALAELGAPAEVTLTPEQLTSLAEQVAPLVAARLQALTFTADPVG